MEEVDKKRFVEIMAYFALNFAEREISEKLVKSYFNDLLKYPIDQIESAARNYVAKGKKFPLVSELISIIEA